MIILTIILYISFFGLNYIYNKYSLYVRFVYFLRDLLIINNIISIYNNCIDYNYKYYLSEKKNCIQIIYKDSIFNGILDQILKFNNEIIIICKNNKTGIIMSQIRTNKIIIKPNRIIRNELYLAIYKTLPKDIIIYIGNYICECKSCKNIAYSV